MTLVHDIVYMVQITEAIKIETENSTLVGWNMLLYISLPEPVIVPTSYMKSLTKKLGRARFKNHFQVKLVRTLVKTRKLRRCIRL